MTAVPSSSIARGWLAADALQFAAAPVFAAMALFAAKAGDAQAALLCPHGASGLGGMAPMYALMSAVHAAPWLRLIRRSPPAA